MIILQNRLSILIYYRLFRSELKNKKNYIHKDNRPELIKYFQKASLNEAESTLLLVNILHKNKTHKLYNLFLKTTTINDKASVIGYVVEAVSKSEKDDDNKIAEA